MDFIPSPYCDYGCKQIINGALVSALLFSHSNPTLLTLIRILGFGWSDVSKYPFDAIFRNEMVLFARLVGGEVNYDSKYTHS